MIINGKEEKELTEKWRSEAAEEVLYRKGFFPDKKIGREVVGLSLYSRCPFNVPLALQAFELIMAVGFNAPDW